MISISKIFKTSLVISGWLAAVSIFDVRAQMLKPGEIVYSRAATVAAGNCDTASIWAVGQDGSNDRFVTNGLHPRISPDGRLLLFKRFAANAACGPFTNGPPQWWTRDLATHRETNISNNFLNNAGQAFSPETNRGEKQIIFDDLQGACRMNLDGTNRACTVFTPRQFGYMSVRGGDGLVAMGYYDTNFPALAGLSTFTYDIDVLTKIPNTGLGDLNPSWSNDGQSIAYAFVPPGRGEPYYFTNVFTIKPDGSGKTQLTSLSNPPNGEGFTYSLVWTKDNLTILNAAKIDGVAGIYRISATGGGILGKIPITPGAAPEWVGGIVPVYSEQQTASIGGGVASGGSFTLADTAGQAFAGQNSAGGGFNLQSGFWTSLPVFRAPFDFDGDGKTDIGVFRPAPAEWWISRSSTTQAVAAQFGQSADAPVPGDYTGDGKADIAFWRPSTGFWFVLRSEDGSFYSFPFGAGGDVPVPADYDADGKTDAAVFRPSTNTWFISNSSGGTTIATFGARGDKPASADYDGDGRSDIAVFRPSTGEWWIQRSASGLIAFQFGGSTDAPVPGDYTGDGKADAAFFRPSTGVWFILRSEDFSFFSLPFGAPGDVPAPGDYDGDGKFDATVYRPSGFTWFINRTSGGVQFAQFGAAGDRPLPNSFVP